MTRHEVYKEVLSQKEELLQKRMVAYAFSESLDNFTIFEEIRVKGLVLSIKKYFTNPELVEICAMDRNYRPLIWIDLFPISELIVSGYLTENSQNNFNIFNIKQAFRTCLKTYISIACNNLPSFVGVYNPEDIMVGALHRKSNYKKKNYNYWLISNNIEFNGYI